MKIQGDEKLEEKGLSPLIIEWIFDFYDSIKSDRKYIDYKLVIIETMRTFEKQKEYVRTGKSKTLKSKHLEGKAVDIAFSKNGKIDWNDLELWNIAYNHFKFWLVKKKLKGQWGGVWKFRDCPHFQLDI